MDRRKALTVVLAVIVLLGALVVLAGGLTAIVSREEEKIRVLHYAAGDFDVYEGAIDTPTPCHILYARPEIAGEPPELTLSFTTISRADLCAGAAARKRFKIEYPRGAAAGVNVVLNGISLPIDLIEVAPRSWP